MFKLILFLLLLTGCNKETVNKTVVKIEHTHPSGEDVKQYFSFTISRVGNQVYMVENETIRIMNVDEFNEKFSGQIKIYK